jgi:hypothetical protein
VLKIRGLLEEHYLPTAANRMLSALRGVLRECWQAQLMSIEEYQAATSIPTFGGSRKRADATSPPASCAAAPLKDTGETRSPGAGATLPSWPWPTAVDSVARRQSQLTLPTSTWSAANCEYVVARVASRASSPCRRRLFPPSRTGCMFAAPSLGRSSVRCSSPGASYGRAMA